MLISTRFKQSEKADCSILVIDSGIMIDLILVHPQKAAGPIVFRDFPNLTEVRPVHSRKESQPILLTESGIVIDVIRAHPRKAPSPMVFTFSGILTLLSFLQSSKA